MHRAELPDLGAFIVVVEERSFTRAAARLGTSQSALSHMMRRLEERLGEAIARDMVAVRIGPELRMACVAAPTYFAVHDMPQVPQDLAQHRCINMRMASTSALYAWEFEKDGRQLNYYRSRRQPTPAFALVVDALRYRS